MSTKTAEFDQTIEMLADGRDWYAETFHDVFHELAASRGWPDTLYRDLRRFFETQSTPAYWASLPPEEAQAQLLQWIYAKHRGAPYELWQNLPLAAQVDMASQWVDTQEQTNGNHNDASAGAPARPVHDGTSY